MFVHARKISAALGMSVALTLAPAAHAAVTFYFTETDSPSEVSAVLTLDVATSPANWQDSSRGTDTGKVVDFTVNGSTWFGLPISISKTSVLGGEPGTDYYEGQGRAEWNLATGVGNPLRNDGEFIAQERDAEYQPIGGQVLSWYTYDYKVLLSSTQIREEFTYEYCAAFNNQTGECATIVTSDGNPITKIHNGQWVVPVPAAMPLLASALLGLGAIARRRKAA